MPNTTAATWTELNFVTGWTDGKPLFFEIWHDGWGDTLIGGFVVYPRSGQSEYVTRILWDWKDRSKVARRGLGTVHVEFSSRVDERKAHAPGRQSLHSCSRRVSNTRPAHSDLCPNRERPFIGTGTVHRP